MLIELAHHHRLDGGEEFGGGYRANAQRRCESQRRAHVPANHATAWGNAQLAPKPSDKVPDLPAFETQRLVQDLWAGFAGFLTGLAVFRAPAEDPLGKGDETFFS